MSHGGWFSVFLYNFVFLGSREKLWKLLKGNKKDPILSLMHICKYVMFRFLPPFCLRFWFGSTFYIFFCFPPAYSDFACFWLFSTKRWNVVDRLVLTLYYFAIEKSTSVYSISFQEASLFEFKPIFLSSSSHFFRESKKQKSPETCSEWCGLLPYLYI